jgi:hypothetical protein
MEFSDYSKHLKDIYLQTFPNEVEYVSDYAVVFTVDDRKMSITRNVTNNDDELFWLSMIFLKMYIEGGEFLSKKEIESVNKLARNDEQKIELTKLLLIQ